MTTPAAPTSQARTTGVAAARRPDDVSELVDRPPCVGVLFVHGAGDHGVGATLIEFGEPLAAWLDGWVSHGAPSPTSATDTARVGASQILVREADAHAPAHAVVSVDAGPAAAAHTWLLAEARWDEAFTPPAFGQVLRWAIGVVPWTILTQFIGPLARQSRFVEANPWSVLGFLWRVVVAATTALVVAAILQVFALAILVLSIIPIAAIRDLVSRLQRFASTGVGDLYMVLSSPIQRAALTSAVQRDIDWLRQQGCERIAVVAHSQGGYVAYQALADPWSRKVELFITFGSGLIRLVESERARRTGALVPALIGTVGALVAIRFLPIAILGEAGVWEKHQASGLAFVIGALLSLVLVRVMWAYFHDRSRVPDLPRRIRWYDVLTKEDPVMNRHRTDRLPRHVRQIRTQNRGSVIADHGSYWLNSDEFVPQVAIHLSQLDPELRLLRAGPRATAMENARHLRRSVEQRHSRVAALRLRGALLIAGTLGLIAVRADQLTAIGGPVADWLAQLPSFLVSWVPGLVRSVLPIEGLEEVLLGAAVVALISALAARVGSALWDAWGRADTADQYAGRNPAGLDRAAVAFHSWTLLHLLVLGLVAIVGLAPLVDGLGYFVSHADRIVQAWARHYPWSLGVGAIVAAVLIRRDGPPYRVAVPAWVIAGMVLALVVELAIAFLAPGATEAVVAIPTAIVVAILSLVVAWFGWPVLRRTVAWLAAIGERQRKEKREADLPASIIDYLGVAGALIALLTVPIVVFGPSLRLVEPVALWRVTALLALIALLLGIVAVANARGVSLHLRRGSLAVDYEARASSRSMRVVGLATAVVAWLTLVAALARFAREARWLG
jgi:hypothetical protein